MVLSCGLGTQEEVTAALMSNRHDVSLGYLPFVYSSLPMELGSYDRHRHHLAVLKAENHTVLRLTPHLDCIDVGELPLIFHRDLTEA